MKALVVVLLLTLSTIAHAECYATDDLVVWLKLSRAQELLKAAMDELSRPAPPSLEGPFGSPDNTRFAMVLGQAAEKDIQAATAFAVSKGERVVFVEKVTDVISHLKVRGHDVFAIAASVECE